ncbi:MAG: IS630 family transposase [Candidatus Binatia bacterium]
MPKSTIVEIPLEEQARMRAELRRARYGYLLALHLLLLCAAGRTPSEVASVLFCSRSSVYRIIRAYRAGTLPFTEGSERGTRQRRLRLLTPALKRSVRALLKLPPRAVGWCRTRWSCATLAVELQMHRGLEVSAETLRHWFHELGWEWKRAKVAAKDDDSERVTKLARIRLAYEQLRAGAALFFADELDIHLWPKVGYQWTPRGEQVEGMPPGTNEKRYLAGALDLTTGSMTSCVWSRKQTGLFLDLLDTLDRMHPASLFSRLTVVVDNAKIHHAQKVPQWLAAHPRFEMLYFPTYCPRANPIERAFGDVHDKCTRNHTRKRRWHLVQDVRQHLRLNGPWRYALSEIYYTPEVTEAVAALQGADSSPPELSQLAA